MISMMDNGRTIKPMDMGFIITKMGTITKGNGKMIYKMDMELRNGLMGRCMKGGISMGKSMEKESTLGLMVPHMMEIGRIIQSTDL